MGRKTYWKREFDMGQGHPYLKIRPRIRRGRRHYRQLHSRQWHLHVLSERNFRPAARHGQPGFEQHERVCLRQLPTRRRRHFNHRPPAQMKLGSHGIGLFAQDSWKVTRKLTLDYGLRYDFQTYLQEQ